MKDITLIDKAANYVRSVLLNFEESGHDWFHTYRVWKTAREIARYTECNLQIVELGALFHDIADAKFTEGDETLALKKTEKWLRQAKVEENDIIAILHIVNNISWRKHYKFDSKKYPELAIVQDADRLDAIGAIGIARAFSYGGFANRPIYLPPSEIKDFKENRDTITHFYDKLLHIKDSLHTTHAHQIAQQRHAFMLQFLDQFKNELEN